MDPLTRFYQSWVIDIDGAGLPVWHQVPALATQLWDIDRGMMAVMVYVCVWMLLAGRISYLLLLVIIPVCAVLGDDQLITPLINPLLGQVPVADTGQFVVLAVLATVLALMVIVRRAWRTRDRIVVAAVAGSMAVTGVLFHGLVVHGLMMTAMHTHQDTLDQLAFALADDHPEALEQVCEALAMTCRRGDRRALLADQRPWVIERIQAAERQWPPGVSRLRLSMTRGGGTDLRTGAPYSVVYVAPGQGHPGLLIYDDFTPLPLHAAGATTFFVQLFIVHSVWMSLGLLILAVHDGRFHRGRRGPVAEVKRLGRWLRRRSYAATSGSNTSLT